MPSISNFSSVACDYEPNNIGIIKHKIRAQCLCPNCIAKLDLLTVDASGVFPFWLELILRSIGGYCLCWRNGTRSASIDTRFEFALVGPWSMVFYWHYRKSADAKWRVKMIGQRSILHGLQSLCRLFVHTLNPILISTAYRFAVDENDSDSQGRDPPPRWTVEWAANSYHNDDNRCVFPISTVRQKNK